MTTNVLQTVKGALTPEVTAEAASRLGEQPAALGTAVQALIPGVFRLLSRRAAEAGGPEALLAAIRKGGVAFALNDPLGRLPVGGGANLSALGDDGPALATRAAEFAGVSPASGEALTAMIAPLALSALARTAPPPLNAETLGRTLREQDNNIDRGFPPGFTLGAPEPVVATPGPASPKPALPEPSQPGPAPVEPASTAGPSTTSVTESIAPEPAPTPIAQTPEPTIRMAEPAPAPPIQPPMRQSPREDDGPGGSGGLPRWLLPLLAALILLVVTYALYRGLAGGDQDEPALVPTVPSDTVPSASVPPS